MGSIHVAGRSLTSCSTGCSTRSLARVCRYPLGTVSAIYTTTDGGSGMQDLYDLVALLGEHVELVDHEALADFALRHHRMVGQRAY